MSEALFLRLLPFEDKSSMLAEIIEDTRLGYTQNSVLYVVEPTSFSQIPGSTFAYWISERIRRIFTRFPVFESKGRTVKQGLATADDFRFVRLWWEVKPEDTISGTGEIQPEQFRRQTFIGKRWVSFAKGGAYSPYYSGLHLVVNWERDGEEVRNFKNLSTGKSFSRPQNIEFYFRTGLTWSIKNRFSFKPRPLNRGCIFAHVGAAAFTNNESDLLSYQGLLSSSVFTALLRVTAGWNFEVGVIQRTPTPPLSDIEKDKLAHHTLACINIKRTLERSSETSRTFTLPALMLVVSPV